MSTEATSMPEVILECRDTAAEAPCGYCGQQVQAPAGARLILADTEAPICADCARQHAPSLAALVSLADAADRIGRIGRHSVFPPLTALLDLASAAEKYTSATRPPDAPAE
jgi:hypothetical protein